MARRGGGSTQRQVPQPVPNGFASNGHTNGLPPPSTIPAQIIQGAAIVKAQQNTINKQPFIELVKEFLSNPALEDPDPVCIAFILAITEGGIDPFFKDDPFALKHLEEQGTQCIAALIIIFQQKPYLLFSPTHAEEEDENPHPPVIVWLFSKVLGLLAQESLLNIHTIVLELLSTCLKSFTRSASRLRHARLIFQLYRSCIQSISDALELREEAIESLPPHIEIFLPSSSSIGDIWPDSQHLVALPQGLQRNIRPPVNAVYLGFRLLEILIECCLNPKLKVADTSTFEHLRPWSLNSCLSLWNRFDTWNVGRDRGRLHDDIEALYMQLLSILALPSIGSEDDSSSSSSTTLSFTTGLISGVQSCLSTPFSETNQIRLAFLINELHSVLEDIPDEEQRGLEGRRQWQLKNVITDSMFPAVRGFCHDVLKFTTLHEDLQLSLCLWTMPGDWPVMIQELRTLLCSDTTQIFSTDELNDQSIAITKTFRQVNKVDKEPPAKRRRTVPEVDEDTRSDIFNRLVSLLNGSASESPVLHLKNFHALIQAKYSRFSEDPRVSEQAQSEMILALSKIACAGSQCLNSTDISEDCWQSSQCILCDATGSLAREARVYWNQQASNEMWKDVIAGLIAITQEEKFQQSSRPRVLMAVAIGRIFNHISEPEYLSLETSSLGEWLLKSMQRSLRELRIAASRSLMAFLRDDISRHVRDKNRRATMQFLAELTKRNNPSQQETLIMAYGQAARTCSGEELHIILGQLVEYLGHTNTVIYGAAYNELSSLADDLNTSPQELLRPYWRTIGFSIVNDLNTNPQKAKFVVELIGEISYVSQLLILIHEDVLPVLVLNKRTDILQRIANAKKTSIEEICLQPRSHLARIIALLICQSGSDIERRAMDTLVAVAPGLRQTGQMLHDLVQLDAAAMASEVFKLAADRDANDKALFYEGIRRLAALDDIKSDLDRVKQKDGKRKAASKKKTKDLVETFILKHVLGVMADFTNPIENQLGNHHLSERKRCVGAIKELITFAREDSCHALTQIRACLQSAMADPHLCDQAFEVWSLLLTVLEETHLKLVLGQTFALIVHNWTSFSDETRLRASATLETLRKQRNQLLQSQVGQLASLASIPMLSKLDAEMARLKAKKDPVTLLNYFSERCNDENSVVVQHALKELVSFLEEHQKILHQSAIDQKPLPALITLSRSLLDICVRFPGHHVEIRTLCAQCLGIIGGLDPYRVETVREKKQVLVLHNFEQAAEVIQFVAFMLEEVLVKVFLSTTNARSQGWLAWLMQELCALCGFDTSATESGRAASQSSPATQRWDQFPEPVQKVLTPFLDSKYRFTTNEEVPVAQYPIFGLEISHALWLRTFTYDILQKAKVQNAKMFFPTIGRVARREDLSIASFILPYAVLSVIVGGDEVDASKVGLELLTVLRTDLQGVDHTEAMNIKQCSENVFQVLDYLALWLQEKRKAMSEARAIAGKTGRGISEMDEIEAIKQFSAVEQLLQRIPAKVISKRAVECGSYARALFHWEQYYREEQHKAETTGGDFAKDEMLQHLQHIYAQIDEPDSIEGISAHLLVLNPEQQIMEHRKAGRWTAAQTWYELALAERPNDPDTQVNLLTCLKESGQYDAILNYVDGFHASNFVSSSTLPFAAEAAWSTGKWDQLERILTEPSRQLPASSSDFNVGVGKALLALRHNKAEEFSQTVNDLRAVLSNGLSASVTASLHNSHEYLVKLHTLYELESISGLSSHIAPDREVLFENLDRRLDILGAYTSDKQYLLGVRRAAMQLSQLEFTNLDVASAWLTTARLARKGEFSSAAFNSIMHATQLGDDASKIEYSKMLWKEGHHRKAIQNLRGALATNSFATRELPNIDVSVSVSTTTSGDNGQSTNRVKCHAQLLLAKWLDRAGQTQSLVLKEEYAKGIMTFPKWDKGHYYLGRYYLKLYETEKALPPAKQASNYLAGELTKLVIENYIRSTVYGSKYYYQTIPKILTLWLDMGMEVMSSQPRLPKDKELHQHKMNHLTHVNAYVKRYASERMPAYPWYTAFPQIITRISHPNKSVWEVLQLIIIKVTGQYPQQALWGLLAVQNSQQDDRRARGSGIMQKLRDHSKRKNGALDLKTLITHGQRLVDALLAACDLPVEQRVSHVSLSKDLRFSTKLAPCALVVPIEATMTPSLPSTTDSRQIRAHNPFPQDVVTISEFKDDVLVLSSLQRPRKITVRGSDGRSYGLLCKPKDDLRKDQRLMEFNAMINRALTRNIEASKRRLYIKTYGVTPLNEECGTIEWVEGLKPMRDIIIRLYRQKSISIDYQEIRMLLNEACADPAHTNIFTHKILARFQPVLHEWFVETFPEPEAWFAARLRYTRSCAVMSIVGHALGLGDRHGENVLLEEGNGGTFHVDFNCLFDKGLTFEKPELVPFRLTHNMVDAMGPAGIEGPFRKTAELTYSLLRQHEDALITILETFVHDPTADFLGQRKKKRFPGVPESPQEVLEIVRGKLGGFVRGESVPLSVEGYVDSLVRQARDPKNLAAMYIGWCAFF
ncbi:serine/threonine-protein kinase M1 [Kalmusia sp. IMI 367209]|nr:serine/threonine-protein kinase M1 [Kalmusia sp. IMI 367209]